MSMVRQVKSIGLDFNKVEGVSLNTIACGGAICEKYMCLKVLLCAFLCYGSKFLALKDFFKMRGCMKDFLRQNALQTSLKEEVVKQGRLDVIQRLMTEAVKSDVDQIIAKIFQVAAQHGHLSIMRYLVDFAADNAEAMIVADEFIAFHHAAVEGFFEIVRYLIEDVSSPDMANAMISSKNFSALCKAAFHGRLDILRYLINHWIECSPDKAQAVSAVVNSDVLNAAAYHGSLDVVDYLIELAPDKVAMIERGNYGAFHNAIIFGQFHILNRFMELFPDKVQAMFEANNFESFRRADLNGTLSVIKFLIEHAPNYDIVQAMIAVNHFEVFHRAVADGSFAIVKYLLLHVSNQDVVQALIEANNFHVFYQAVIRGSLDMVRYLIELASHWDGVQAMIVAAGVKASFHSSRLYSIPVFNYLLQYTSFFDKVEILYRYDEYIKSFIQEKLHSLHTEYQALAHEHPDAVFNVSTEDARLYFYFIRHFIREQTPEAQKDIEFLLSIPAVKALVYTTVTPREPYELLRCALLCENTEAVMLLSRSSDSGTEMLKEAFQLLKHSSNMCDEVELTYNKALSVLLMDKPRHNSSTLPEDREPALAAEDCSMMPSLSEAPRQNSLICLRGVRVGNAFFGDGNLTSAMRHLVIHDDTEPTDCVADSAMAPSCP